MLLTYAEESLLRRLGYLKITQGLTPAQESDLTYLLNKKDKDDAAHRTRTTQGRRRLQGKKGPDRP